MKTSEATSEAIKQFSGLKNMSEKIWFMIFIFRYEDNSNTTCLKRFEKFHALQKRLQVIDKLL